MKSWLAAWLWLALVGIPARAKDPELGTLFQPRKGLIREASLTGLPLEDVQLLTQDRVRIHGWWLPTRPGNPVILYFHGNGGNLNSTEDTLRIFRRAGWGALAIDYRGYGKSQGMPSEAGLYLDARAAYDECRRRKIVPADLWIHGQSMGGGVASELALQVDCAGLVLESTFTSAPEAAGRLYGGWVRPLMKSRFANLEKMPRLKVPLLVIHGSLDSLLPCSMGERLYQAAPQPKRFWPVAGADHHNLRFCAGSEYIARLRRFFKDCRRR